MPTYAIGDIQGCYSALQCLLDKIHFNRDNDQLWFVGDLVNRGAQNIETLRFIKDLEERAVVTLGNHDLHLLAIAYGHREINNHRDTFHDVVEAPDFDELIDWLRHRPIMHHDADSGYTMVHAGLPPQWNLARALQCANEIEQVLRSDMIDSFLANMYGDQPDQWSDTLQSWERLRYITNSFTRIRYCDADGREDFNHNREPGTQPSDLFPWFQAPNRQNSDLKIIFGHWAALGRHLEENIFGIDSGCVWGGNLTAMRVGKAPKFIQVECPTR